MAAQRQHVVNARLEVAGGIDPSVFKEAARAGVSLVDQAVDLAEVGTGGAKLDVGDEQRDLSLVWEALIFLQGALTQHDLDALRQDARQGVVLWPQRVRGAVVCRDALPL